MKKPFLILSVDGGGFRGTYATRLLQRIEEEWQVDWLSKFSFFAGTSTGSIIASGLATGRSAAHLSSMYTELGRVVFPPIRGITRSIGKITPLFRSRYSRRTFYDLLQKEFGDIRLGEIETPLMIPAVDIGAGAVHVLKSRYQPDYYRDGNVRLVDAIAASCAAPTYFDPFSSGSFRLADGGLWANNPTMAAVVDVVARFDIDLRDIRVLSVGNGKRSAEYPRNSKHYRQGREHRLLGWGLLTKWGGTRFIDLVMKLQSDASQNLSGLLLPTGSLLRVDFESQNPLPLDDTSRADDWLGRADSDFARLAHRIAPFIGVEG